MNPQLLADARQRFAPPCIDCGAELDWDSLDHRCGPCEARRPEIRAALREADRLVAPWLHEHKDSWRKDQDGLPVLDDLWVALARVRCQRQVDVDLRVRVRGYASVYVSEHQSREEYEAETLPEALLLMLADDLRRTCAVCREYDGHDTTCSVWQDEEEGRV